MYPRLRLQWELKEQAKMDQDPGVRKMDSIFFLGVLLVLLAAAIIP